LKSGYLSHLFTLFDLRPYPVLENWPAQNASLGRRSLSTRQRAGYPTS
jgi:hypothetical protein